MPAPAPVIPTGQPTSGSTAKLEIALAYDSVTNAAVATPVFVQLPVMGEVTLTPQSTDTDYDAYAASGSDVWSYAVKTGMRGTLTFKVGAPDSDPAVKPFVVAGLKAGNAALIHYRYTRASGTIYSGAATLGLNGLPDPVRGVSETMWSCKTSGPITPTFPT